MIKNIIKIIAWAIITCLLFTIPGLTATAQYTYDNLNRLVQVQLDDGTTIQYTYDAAGNRVVKQVTAFTPPEAPGGSSPLSGQGAQVPANAPTLQNSRAPAGSQ